MHDLELPEGLAAVARAGAGVNNIPLDKCAEKGIVVFNTPGANANAVKELVLASAIMAGRNVFEGVQWTQSLKGTEGVEKAVEAGKKQFVGPEIKNKKLGVIGLGAIGAMVANDAYALGMEVIGYDPFLTVEAAWTLHRNIQRAATLEALVADCDIITIHIPLMDKTRNMIDEEIFNKMQNGV